MSTEHDSNWAGLAAGAPATVSAPATVGPPATASEPAAIRPGLDWPDGQLPLAGSTGWINAVPAWLRFFHSELRLMFGRPRNLALLGVLAIAGVFFGIVLRVTISSGGSGGFPFLNQLAGNGVFLALVMLALTVSLPLLPLAVSVVSGDAIAGEAGHGTLRVLLTVPAGRTRLLAVKYAAIGVFSLAACLLITVVSLIMGLILFHTGPVTLLSGNTISLGAGVARVLVATAYLAVAMTSFGAIGLAASTLTQHPVGAIATLLVLAIGSEICDQLPQLSAIHSFLPTHYWLAWDGLFRSPVDWSGIEHGLVSSVVYAAIFAAIGWAKLTSADITS